MKALFFVILVALFGAHVCQAEAPPQFILSWTAAGSAIASDGANLVYALGSDNVIKFTSQGAYLTEWGTPGSAEGQLYWPSTMAVDPNGNVLIGDGTLAEGRVQKFTGDGMFLGILASPFWDVTAVTTDMAGNVYIVVHYRDIDYIYGFSNTGGSSFYRQGTLSGIAVGATGNLYFCDVQNQRIVEYTIDGVLLQQWGSPGSGEGQFSDPRSLAIDVSGNIYVADSGNYRIQKFDSSGTFLTMWGTQGSGDGQFESVWDLDVDILGNVYVLDLYSGRIQKFGYLPTPVRMTSWSAIKAQYNSP